jgi:excisionase family DNA binding protein
MESFRTFMLDGREYSMEEFLTPQEVAARLRVKATTVRRWIATGVLEAETIQEGKRNWHRIKKSLIETMTATSSTAVSQEP